MASHFQDGPYSPWPILARLEDICHGDANQGPPGILCGQLDCECLANAWPSVKHDQNRLVGDRYRVSVSINHPTKYVFRVVLKKNVFEDFFGFALELYILDCQYIDFSW
jgi:hypothetical protein